MGPLADFDLGEHARPPRVTPRRVARTAVRTRRSTRAAAGAGRTPADLPLFGDLAPDDAPLVRPAAPAHR